MNEAPQRIFKICPMCSEMWISMDAFLEDPSLVYNGYQANFGTIELGFFYFTHDTAECGSTMVIKTQPFLSLYSGRRYTGIKTLSKECPRLCLNRTKLKRCQAQCEYAFVREVSQIIMDRAQKTVKLFPDSRRK